MPLALVRELDEAHRVAMVETHVVDGEPAQKLGAQMRRCGRSVVMAHAAPSGAGVGCSGGAVIASRLSAAVRPSVLTDCQEGRWVGQIVRLRGLEIARMALYLHGSEGFTQRNEAANACDG